MIAEIVAHLKASAGSTGLQLVGGAAEFDVAAGSAPTAVPAAFVIPLEETPGGNRWGDVIAQNVQATVGIVLVVRNVADPKGEAALDALQTLRAAVKSVLYGWAPLAGCDPFERGRSHLLAIKNSHLWWQDIYATSFIDKV